MHLQLSLGADHFSHIHYSTLFGIRWNKNNHRENPRENFEKSVTSVSHTISTSSTFSVLYFAVALTYQAKYKKAKSELT